MKPVVIKIGGSMIRLPQQLRKLCQEIGTFPRKVPLLIIPGGSDFADLVRKIDDEWKLSNSGAHWMAIYGMHQYGLLLSELIPNCHIIDSEILSINDIGFAPSIILPIRFLQKNDVLAHDWRITSDSIALLIAHHLNAEKLVLVKDVDGIFTKDPSKDTTTTFIPVIQSSELRAYTNTCLDQGFYDTYTKYPIPCSIVNGQEVSRVLASIRGEPVRSTMITLD